MTMNCGFMPICGFEARSFRPSRSTRAADSVAAGRTDVCVTGAVELGLAEVRAVFEAGVGRGYPDSAVRGSPDPVPEALASGSDGTKVVFASSPRQPLTITGMV